MTDKKHNDAVVAFLLTLIERGVKKLEEEVDSWSEVTDPGLPDDDVVGRYYVWRLLAAIDGTVKFYYHDDYAAAHTTPPKVGAVLQRAEFCEYADGTARRGKWEEEEPEKPKEKTPDQTGASALRELATGMRRNPPPFLTRGVTDQTAHWIEGMANLWEKNGN